jgi:hypothetical protein
MLMLAAFALLAFWFRDYLALRMSPSRQAARRALAYAAAILLIATFLWALVTRIGVWEFTRSIESPPILFLLIAFHVVASLLSLWVKRTESYNWMWATAFIPAPIVWLLVLETTLLSKHGSGALARQFSFFGVAFLWATSMFAAIFHTRHSQMPLDDLDFAVFCGGLSHWLIICAVPLTVFVLD